MSQMADLFVSVRLNLETGEFQAQAVKAGETAGAAMSTRLTSKLRSGLEEFGKGMAIGAGIAAFGAITGAIDKVANAIPNLIAQGQAYSLSVHDIQEVTGASAAQASIFAGTLMALGIPTGNLNANFRILSTQVAANSAVFKSNGIAIADAAGHQLNILTIIDNVRAKLSTMTDAASRNALATKLLGRSGLELIDYLKLADPQVQMLTQRLVDFGLVLSQDTVDAAKKSIYEQKQLDLAFTGLGVTLFTVVGPIIRTVMSQISGWVATNGQTIKETISTIAAAISGLIGGLTGWDMSGVNDFSTALMGAGGAVSATKQLNDDLGTATKTRDDAKTALAKLTAATHADTTAVDANIASVEKQITAIDTRETAQETAYTKSMGRLGDELQAQLDLLDAQDKAAALAQRDRDLQITLAAAYEDLRKARDTTGGKTIDRAAELKAQQDIAAAQGQIAANVVADAEAKRRLDIENTKKYVESVVALEKDATNRTALAVTLGKRQTSLEASLAAAKQRGDLTAVADITTKLEAVKTTETRNQAAIRNAGQKTELEKTKTQLQELKKSITDAFAATNPAVDAAKVKLQEAEDAITRARAALVAFYLSHSGPGGHGKENDSMAPLGAGGGLAAGFAAVAADWKKTGADMQTTIQGIIDKIGELGSAIGDLGNGFRYVTDPDFRNRVDAMARAQGQSAPSGPVGDFLGWLGGVLQAGATAPHDKPIAPKAAGGWVGLRGPELVLAGEIGPEYVVPHGALGSFASTGVPPHSHDIVMDGQKVALAVDQRFARLPRR